MQPCLRYGFWGHVFGKISYELAIRTVTDRLRHSQIALNDSQIILRLTSEIAVVPIPGHHSQPVKANRDLPPPPVPDINELWAGQYCSYAQSGLASVPGRSAAAEPL
jgi:hypothetical protein